MLRLLRTTALCSLILVPSIAGAMIPGEPAMPGVALPGAGEESEEPDAAAGEELPRGASPVPEPGTLMLTGIGIVVLGVHLASRRRRRDACA